ncbi:MAG: AAA family ATPase [Candidatus Aenigmarchaeota archaeon]|nr:AAA family ATPase [Candidatus Aenigmarchaeota archaeon]
MVDLVNGPEMGPREVKIGSGRVKTGIPGLDEITNGGIPEGHTVLISGTAGTGKTILCSQYLYQGVTRYKEPGVYLSFEESTESIKRNALNFGMDFAALEASKKFRFVTYDPYHIDDIGTHLESTIREIGAKRVAIDSISALNFYMREGTNFRRVLLNISNALKKMKCTTFLISEIVAGTQGLSRNGLEEFIADAALVLYYNRIDSSFSRAIQVWKMRGTSHSESLHPYKITKEGINIYSSEEAFVDMKHRLG